MVKLSTVALFNLTDQPGYRCQLAPASTGRRKVGASPTSRLLFIDDATSTTECMDGPLSARSTDDAGDCDSDRETWEIYRCWKEQQANRFGAGTPAPSTPPSQRQFDGDNWLDQCEPWLD